AQNHRKPLVRLVRWKYAGWLQMVNRPVQSIRVEGPIHPTARLPLFYFARPTQRGVQTREWFESWVNTTTRLAGAAERLAGTPSRAGPERCRFPCARSV